MLTTPLYGYSNQVTQAKANTTVTESDKQRV